MDYYLRIYPKRLDLLIWRKLTTVKLFRIAISHILIGLARITVNIQFSTYDINIFVDNTLHWHFRSS